TNEDPRSRSPHQVRALTAAASSVIGSNEKCAATIPSPWRDIRRPATGLSKPPLRSTIPLRTMSDPDELRADRAGLGLILHSSNQGPPSGEDREPPTLDAG